MKKFILTIFICILTSLNYCYGQNTYNNYTIRQNQNNKVGYTTRYGYGFNTQSNKSNSPRRVSGYNKDGDYIDDGNGYGDNDSTYFWNWVNNGGQIYYYNGNWYLYDPKADDWSIWKSKEDHWAWYYSTSNPHYYNPFTHGQNPSDYGMTSNQVTPIGEAPILLFILCIIYISIKFKFNKSSL